MEKQYSVQFFSSFVENLQRLCQDYITYDQMVEVSGYISVEIDNAKKERYVLSELVQSTGNVISESYCTKVFKNCPLPLQRSPSQRREPPIMSQTSPAGKRPFPSQASPRMNQMGRSPQMNRQMSPSGVLRQSNDNTQRPSSFSQRLNQSSNMGRGGSGRMSQDYSGNTGPGRGGMSSGPRFSSHGAPAGRGMGGNPRMVNPSPRMSHPGGPRHPGSGTNSIQARRNFGPNQGQRPANVQGQTKSPVEIIDPDELEVISYVPPQRRSVGESSVSSLSSGTKSPMTPDPSGSGPRASFQAPSNRSGGSSSQSVSHGQSSSQGPVLPVSLVQNVAQSAPSQMSRNQNLSSNTQQSQDFQRSSMQHSSTSHSSTVSQSSDSRSQMNHQNLQSSNGMSASHSSEPTSQSQPTRQQIVQQMLQARANRNLQIPPTLRAQQGPPVNNQAMQQGSNSMSGQQMPQPTQPKPSSSMPQQAYPNQNYGQPQMPQLQPINQHPQAPRTPPGQIVPSSMQDTSRSLWENFPQTGDKKELETLSDMTIPVLEPSICSSGSGEISARNQTFMTTSTDRTSLAVTSSMSGSGNLLPTGHASFPNDPMDTLQISNVVSLPTDNLPLLPGEPGAQDSSAVSTQSVIAEAFASLESVDFSATQMTLAPATLGSDNSNRQEDESQVSAKKPKLDASDSADVLTSTGVRKPTIPIGRKIKEFAAKKRAKRGRQHHDQHPKSDKGDSEEEEEEFDAAVSVDPSFRSLRSKERGLSRRTYNESSDSESSFPEPFGLNFESSVTTSKGADGDAGDGGDSNSGGGGGGGGSDTAPGPSERNTEKMSHGMVTLGSADSRKSPDDLSEADNESYVLIELESDDEDAELSGAADSSTPIVKQELNTFSKSVQFAVNRLTQFMMSRKIKEPAYSVVPETLDSLLADFYLRLRRSDGQEFLASSLKQVQVCLATYLNANSYPFCIKTNPKFEKSRTVMENKLQHLRSREDAIFTLRSEDVDKLFEVGQLGARSSSSLINTLWLMNTVHFGLRRPRDHINLKWGQVALCREKNQEYVQHIPSGAKVHKNHQNPQRCYVTLYKKFKSLRPSNASNPESHFYLNVSEKTDSFTYQKYGDYKMAIILKRMLSAVRLPPEMKISNLDIL